MTEPGWLVDKSALIGLVVLHDDKDFEPIAEVTGQEIQRLGG